MFKLREIFKCASLKFTLYGRKQTNRHTDTSLQCTPTCVWSAHSGLPQWWSENELWVGWQSKASPKPPKTTVLLFEEGGEKDLFSLDTAAKKPPSTKAFASFPHTTFLFLLLPPLLLLLLPLSYHISFFLFLYTSLNLSRFSSLVFPYFFFSPIPPGMFFCLLTLFSPRLFQTYSLPSL